jgi:hypothetical protein
VIAVPAWLVLLSAVVVVVDAIAVAMFMLRWERRTAAPPSGVWEEVRPSVVDAASHAARHRSPTVHAETRADALSS